MKTPIHPVEKLPGHFFKIHDSRLSKKALLALVTVPREDRELLEKQIREAWACAYKHSVAARRRADRGSK